MIVLCERRNLLSLYFISFLFSGSLFGQNLISVYFNFNKYDLSEHDKHRLDSLSPSLINQKNLLITISGYCDSVGSNSYNDQLSLHRAMTAKNYLASKGISLPYGYKINGFGKRKPANTNKTKAERQENRRVDITFTSQSEIIVNKDTTYSLTRTIDSSKTGSKIILKNINFYGGLHQLLPASKPVLDTLLKILIQHSETKIRIEGHVCCTLNGIDGEDYETHSWNLSWGRAKAIYDYLTQHGINQNRLSYIGKAGKYHLVDPELTEDDRIKNRRVEIVIVKK
jgi:outer membrane protein OmpA-like peptidoglycan-associated protein